MSQGWGLIGAVVCLGRRFKRESRRGVPTAKVRVRVRVRIRVRVTS